jgi:predicted nucleic acid-binding protein
LHEFWADDVSLLNAKVADPARIHGPRQINDLYLLALAIRNRGRLVTFDKSIPLDAIKGAEKKNLLAL